jgi:hypothetical protein
MLPALSVPTRRSLLAAAGAVGASSLLPARAASESTQPMTPPVRVPFLHGLGRVRTHNALRRGARPDISGHAD